MKVLQNLAVLILAAALIGANDILDYEDLGGEIIQVRWESDPKLLGSDLAA